LASSFWAGFFVASINARGEDGMPQIDFDFPITALVGPNGTNNNKGSVLRAVQGSPGMENLGVYWFSSVDAGDRKLRAIKQRAMGT
jgi:hypothetical protein